MKKLKLFALTAVALMGVSGAKLGFSNQIYGTFDAAVNERYYVMIK